MKMTAAQLCELIQGDLEGDGGVEIYGPSQIDNALPGTVTFLANPRYEEYLYDTAASVVILSRDVIIRHPVKATLIRVDDAYGAMLALAARVADSQSDLQGISALAEVSKDAEIGEDVAIGAFVFVGAGVRIGKGSRIFPQVYLGHGVSVGEDVTLHSGVKVYPGCSIGARCAVHANAVIGSDGFGYRPDHRGVYQKIPHTGTVILESDVEIGANTVIDRATFGETRIQRGTKIDNLVQIAHNVTVGEDTVIAAQAGIAGSTRVGNRSRIGGQVGIVGHLHLAEGLEIQAQSGVQSDKNPAGARLYGSPAIDYQAFLRAYAAFKQMPEHIRRIDALERLLAGSKKDEA